MKTPQKPSWPILLCSLSLTMAGFSQAPSGSYIYHFAPGNGPALWNFSGDYATPYYRDDNILELRHDAAGRLTGSYRSPGSASGAVVGTVRGSGATLKMNLLSEMSFPGANPSLWMRRRDRLALTFDASTKTLSGVDRAEEAYQIVVYDRYPYNHMKTLSRTKTSQPVSMTVPQAADGNWTLTLNIVPAGNKLAGSGTVQFADGTSYELGLMGSYSPNRQKTKLLLKGAGLHKGANLVLSMVNPQMGIETMSGRVAGQSVKLR